MTTADASSARLRLDVLFDCITVVLTLSFALGAFAVAYEAVVWVGLHAVHLSPAAARIFPLVVDLGLAIAAVGAARAWRRKRATGVAGWDAVRAAAVPYALLALLAAASIACQVTHVLETNADPGLLGIGIFLGGVPPIALLLSVEIVLQLIGAHDPATPVKPTKAARKSPKRTSAERVEAGFSPPHPPTTPARSASESPRSRASADRGARFADEDYAAAVRDLIDGVSGTSQNKIGARFGVSKTTVGKDAEYLRSERTLV